MTRKAVTATAVALVAGAVMLVPGSAQASGPTHICYNSAAVSETVGGGDWIQAVFTYDRVFFLSGQFIQNGQHASSPYWAAFRTQISNTNKIVLGARNAQTGPQFASGWLVETWVC
jgi:hypothetical protein